VPRRIVWRGTFIPRRFIMTNTETLEHDTNPIVALLSDAQREQLFANGRAALRHGWFGQPEADRMPVALLRCTSGDFYLLSELDPTEPNIAYCLYEDSEGVPTLDTVDFDAMYEAAEGSDHGFECFADFVPTGTIRAYWRAARKLGSFSALFDHPK
jgi:hypothetical protein